MGTFYILKPTPEAPASAPGVSVRSVNGESSSIAAQQPESHHQLVQASSSDSKKPDSRFSSKEYQELEAWLLDRGYDSYSNRGDYESYSDETLSKLAKTGDLKAIGLLIPKYMEKGDKETATRLMNTAVVYGSIVHLDNLTIYSAPDYTNDKTEESRRPAALETLALTKVMALRGDKSLSEVSANSFIKSYKRKYNTDLTLSEEERKIVDQRAKDIYDDFQQVRRSLGLGDFDNSTPASVNKFFGSSK